MALVREKIKGASEKEIKEQAEEKNARILWCKRYDYIYSAEIEYEKQDEVKIEKNIDNEKKYSVYRYYGNQIKYMGKRGTVYVENLAELYTKQAAVSKAEAMNKKLGGSVWGVKKSK